MLKKHVKALSALQELRYASSRHALLLIFQRIIRFFLHLSKEAQRKRFLDRIDRPEKNWKFSLAGVNCFRSVTSWRRKKLSCTIAAG